jgi:phosphoenolpyruvate carboxykinase (GTP)
MPLAAVPTQHRRLKAWVDEIAKLTEPDQIVWCDGSQAEYDRLFEQMLATGAAERLDPSSAQ